MYIFLYNFFDIHYINIYQAFTYTIKLKLYSFHIFKIYVCKKRSEKKIIKIFIHSLITINNCVHICDV